MSTQGKEMLELDLAWRPVIAALREAVAGISNRRGLMRTVAGIMMSATEDNFERQGRPRWVDLQESTKAARKATGHWPGPILQRSGQLAASIVEYSDNDKAMVGSNKAYARIHQLGGKTSPHVIKPRNKRALAFGGIVVAKVDHPGSTIPARPFLYLSPTDQREIYLAAREFLQGKLDRAAQRGSQGGAGS